MSGIEQLPRVQDLLTQLEWMRSQFATLRAVHIAMVGPAFILATHLQANFKAPLVICEELFTGLEAQLMRAISAIETELKAVDVESNETPRGRQIRAAA